MRTTLSLDPEVLSAARKIAAAKSQSIGRVVSELARKGLETRATTFVKKGFPVFKVSQRAPPLTLADVRRDEDEG